MKARVSALMRQAVASSNRTAFIASALPILIFVSVVQLTFSRFVELLPEGRVSQSHKLLGWDCISNATIIEENPKVGVFNQIARHFSGENASSVVFLEWGNLVGQLCNRLTVLAASLARMKREDLLNDFLGLNFQYSEAARVLDWKLLSSRTRGILFYCRSCLFRGRKDEPYVANERFEENRWDCDVRYDSKDRSPFVRCSQALISGRLYRMNNRILPVRSIYYSDDVWNNDRAKFRGFLAEYHELIQPKPYLKRIVKEAYDRFIASVPGMKVMALHRRSMDGYCYDWVFDIRAHQCVQSNEMHQLASHASRVLSDVVPSSGSRDSAKFTQEQRDALDSANVLLMGCNYTLSSIQQWYILKQWPELNTSKIALIISSDRQDPYGDKVAKTSSLASAVIFSRDLKNAECYSTKQYHNMLADMLLMSMADYHVGNSLSSCGDVVAHWRIGKGKPKRSSFPDECYKGYYEAPNMHAHDKYL